MKELLNSVETLMFEELTRANQDNPLFNSRHEGLAVIEEEAWEAEQEFESVKKCLDKVKIQTYIDDTADADRWIADGLKKYALRAAAELIQTAAMCDKWEMSKEMWNESTNSL